MPFVVFQIGGSLLVLGFAFKVLQVTKGLTDIKSKEAGKKLRNIGGICGIVGALICVVVLVLGMPANERNVMLVAGGDIAAIGIFTLIQYRLKPQTEKVLGCVAIGVIIVGFLLCFAYEFSLIF